MGKRTPVKEKLDVDMSKPIKDLEQFELDIDCFGKEYDQMASECQYCSANVVCSAVYFERNTKKKIRRKRKETGGFLDEVDFENVPWKKIAERVRAGKEFTSRDLVEAVGKLGRCGDHGMVSLRIMRFMAEEGLEVRDGILKVKK